MSATTVIFTNNYANTFGRVHTARHDFRTVLHYAFGTNNSMRWLAGITKKLQIWNIFTIRGLEQWKIQR